MDEAALFFDKGLRGSIENMVICGGPSYGTYGGDLLLYPFDLVVWVYTRQKWLLLMLLWPRRPNLGCYKTTSYVTVAYVMNHAQDFLLAIPIDGLDQHMSPVKYRIILEYRLMIPLFPVDEICPVCRMDIWIPLEHAVHCKDFSGFKYRHDMIRDVLFDICRRARIFA
ncbi:hypothetical protein Tco_0724036 [Tanacetum coccineum]